MKIFAIKQSDLLHWRFVWDFVIKILHRRFCPETVEDEFQHRVDILTFKKFRRLMRINNFSKYKYLFGIRV